MQNQLLQLGLGIWWVVPVYIESLTCTVHTYVLAIFPRMHSLRIHSISSELLCHFWTDGHNLIPLPQYVHVMGGYQCLPHCMLSLPRSTPGISVLVSGCLIYTRNLRDFRRPVKRKALVMKNCKRRHKAKRSSSDHYWKWRHQKQLGTYLRTCIYVLYSHTY